MGATAVIVLAFGVGVSLGLLGGGGSILSVPLLVYVAGWSPHQAATGSLFVVGVTSAIGLVAHARAGRVRWRTGLVFGFAGMPGAYAGGRLAALVPGGVLLVAFALMMLAASAGMIRGRGASRGSASEEDGRKELRLATILSLGAMVGAATGFVGAGGGFVIVPALVLVACLPMPAAAATSLLVIFMQSAAGLAGHLASARLPWALTIGITASAVAGSLAGSRMTGRIPASRLRRGFGYLVLAVAVLVLAEQLPRPVLSRSLPWAAAALATALLAAVLLAVAKGPARVRIDQPRLKNGQIGNLSISPITRSGPGAGPDLNRKETAMPAATTRPSSMQFTQYYIDCLSQASYLIGDTGTGHAVLVDPRRDVQQYLDDAAAAGLRIIGMINTHFHADFLSGHLELARATGAWIGYGQVAETEFESRALADGERVELGDVVLEIMHTPGHTPESISVLVYEHASDEAAYGVLTGDALFVGDVGRPDLLASIGVTAAELGRQLYHSIQHKLLALPDSVRLFPGHGAGSACGKYLSDERQSTIGDQRVTNYACQPMSEEQFIALVTAGQPPAPGYFAYDAMLNRKNRDFFDAGASMPALDDAALDAALGRGAVVLDTRIADSFAAGHLAGAVNVPADGRFAETAGMVLTADEEIVVITPPGRESEIRMRLARIGFDTVAGYVADPEAAAAARPDRAASTARLTPAELAALAAGAPGQAAPVTLDVRNIGELEAGYLPGSVHIPLAELRRRIDEVPAGRPVVVYCASGWRSSVAASLLRRHGRADVTDLLGGFNGWQAADAPAMT